MVLGVDTSGVGTWFSNTGTTIGSIILIFLVVGIVGGGAFIYYIKNNEKKQYNIVVNLFKVVNGKKFWIGSDKAKEVVIPGTNIRLLRWKNKKIWSAYPTRSIGYNVFAYMLNRMGEMTNFDLGETEDPTEARIDYDQRDQTYAYLNLQEFITRNYTSREKQSWWKQNIGLISTIVVFVVFALLMWYFFAQSGKQLEQWSNIATQFHDASKIIGDALSQSKGIGSGVVEGK